VPENRQQHVLAQPHDETGDAQAENEMPRSMCTMRSAGEKRRMSRPVGLSCTSIEPRQR